MKIAIASDDGQRLAAHTGRCQGFVVYEIAEKQARRLEHRANTFTAHARGECNGEAHGHDHDHAHHSHGPLVDAIRDCCVLVTRGLGPRLVNDLSAAGIEAFVCGVTDADQAAQLYAAGQLERASGVGCCQHH